MKILIINCGSSSIKFQVYDADVARALVKGIVAKIGGSGSYLEKETNGVKLREEVIVPTHGTGFGLVIRTLLDREHGVLQDISEIAAVGHRAVHGGDTFIGSVLITKDTIKKMEELTPIAPLHNPAAIVGIIEAKRVLPNIPHVAVFDTTFHQTIPPKAYLYALPYKYYETHKIRKYGFHGTSCRYVCQKVASILGKSLEEVKMIICHLGNGVTLAAVQNGKSIDTSMGLTPLEGLMMGTRSGDIDPGVIFYLHRKVGLTISRIDDLLNRESGILGISGVSNDMKEIEERARSGDERCKLAIEMFAYRVKKCIGAYAAALGGTNTLVFSGGIGENSHVVRAKICEGLEFLGIQLDEDVNMKTRGVEQIISTRDSRVSVIVVPVNEEEVIALDTITVAGLSTRSSI